MGLLRVLAFAFLSMVIMRERERQGRKASLALADRIGLLG
jgi:hypothetical protein